MDPNLKQRGFDADQICSNNETRLTFDPFMLKSNFIPCTFYLEKKSFLLGKCFEVILKE